tara:strand:+ start:520 stop:711 length:192 start_codon:yes stop_codon:yes gene_type:complete
MESLRPTHIFFAFQRTVVAIPCCENPERRAEASNSLEIAMFVAIQTKDVSIQTHADENMNYER